MSTWSADRLYELLPAVYRLRDVQEGEPLRALLGAFAQELDTVVENIEQLYDDQFIETCAPWVTPYIGDLIGYRPLHGNTPQVASPRAEVANTIAFRRRKGTALMLEELARDVTGWPAHAVEFFEQLVTTQYMKHLRPHARATAPLRDEHALLFARSPGAFNHVAHTAELRRPETGAGRYNIPNVGIFLWRLEAQRLSAVPLTPDGADGTGRKFRLNPLGADLRLFRRAQVETDISHLAEPINAPEPLGVRALALAIKAAQASVVPAPDQRLDDDYGAGESLMFWRAGAPPTAVPVADVRVCDLADMLDAGGNVIGWNHENAFAAGTIGVDPERGRVLLGAPGEGPLIATFHYGSARDFGGGEYERAPEGAQLAQSNVGNGGALQPALDAIAGGGRLFIDDSLTYAQTPTFKVDDVTAAGAPGINVVVAARNGARPLIAASGDIVLDIGARGRLVIDGLVFSGGQLIIAAPAAGDAEPRELVLRDCTLVPGLELNGDGSAQSPGAASLIVENPFAKVTLERCITGPLLMATDAEAVLRDCVIDAGTPEGVAYVAPSGDAGGELTLHECTVVGKLHVRLMRLVSNSILFARLGDPATETWTAPVVVERRQEGCVRFSFVPNGSITPRRHRCLPDAAHPAVLPHFTSLRYGDPGYIQLRSATDAAIRHGADDESEMGVLHALFQPQREANLRIRLEEYLRFGLRAGVFYAT